MLQRKHILVVNNNKDVREAFVLLLRQANFGVVSCDLSHSEKIIHQHKPDAAIIDIPYKTSKAMQKITSPLKAIRHNAIPFLIASTDVKIKKMTKELGGNDFLEEPFDIDVLLHKVTKLLRV